MLFGLGPMYANNTSIQKEAGRSLNQQRAYDLLIQMSLAEKIGQMCQLQSGVGHIPEHIANGIRQGEIGSVLNEVDVNVVNELQRLALEESRLGIPLLIGRDVIHGFKTILPIPLGLAASWDADAIEQGCRISAVEATTCGVNWTFAPMIDIARDPRWGRVAESLGEDPYLCSELGVAMVRGFQGKDLTEPGSIAACVKHFAAYGAAEGGRDYNTASVPEVELRNVYLKPFKAAVDANVATLMTAFCEINGVPASGNKWLMNQVLRDEWGFDGMVVSDWASVTEMTEHGYTEDDAQAAFKAVSATVDMEMATGSYKAHLEGLVNSGQIAESHIDSMVMRILELKIELGLFENPYTDTDGSVKPLNDEHLQVAKEATIKSCVLLKNEDGLLPLDANAVNSVAVLGPLADDGYEQMGTWVFDGEAHHSITCLQGIKDLVGDQVEIKYNKVLETTRAASSDNFESAVQTAAECDATILVVGEESFMSGEAHSRADIGLPGHQEALVNALAETGKPLIVVLMAGRPMTIENVVNQADAVLYAWHPGTMGGPALADLIFGRAVPTGKLPITFPRKVGQVPIYYAQKNTGRPACDATVVDMDTVAPRAPQTSLGMTSFHLDAGHTPLFPFGFGLSYTDYRYTDIELSTHAPKIGEDLSVSVTVENIGEVSGEEIVQLYIRDRVGSITRPVRELKGFQRVVLAPGETQRVEFTLNNEDLGFYDSESTFVTEPGRFQVWVGADSTTELGAEFELMAQ